MSNVGSIESPRSIERILVALDTSPQGRRALFAAAELSSRLDAQLDGLFIEDDDLLGLSNLPFVREFGSHSAASRRLDERRIEREYQRQAETLRQAIADTAAHYQIVWSFRVVRGKVSKELLAATQSVGLVILGRVGRSMGKRYGSTAQALVDQSKQPVLLLGDNGLTFPMTVICSASSASTRALHLAILLVNDIENSLRVLFLAEKRAIPEECKQLIDDLQGKGVEVDFQVLNPEQNLIKTLQASHRGLLLLPSDQAKILETLSRSAIVVP